MEFANKMDARLWFMILLSVHLSEEYGTFRDLIPNGHKVPHPCDKSLIWNGVGHKNPGGRGERNPFGVDFAQQGKNWSQTLCQMDSDGDGKKNGEELGDPDCEWTPNSVAKSTQGLSHPGVCEPMNAPICSGKNDFLKCDSQAPCPMEGDAIFETLVFPNTSVPATETSFYCMKFDLTSVDTDYHLIATTPNIKNQNVVHHMLLYGCSDTVNATKTPYRCGMAIENCNDLIGLWAVGFEGTCLHKDAGFKVGKNGYKKMALEIHWNNPEKRADYYDGSGMYVFLTKTLRKYDAGILMVGQDYINIPPRSPRVVVTANCSRSDTSRFVLNGAVNISSAYNHMHNLGKEMKLEHYRDNTKLRNFTYENDYSYDRPKSFRLSPPVEFRAGDEIITTCVYSSININRTVMRGDATTDEMCYGFLVYYPKENLQVQTCTQWQTISQYALQKEDAVINNCYYQDFVKSTHPNTAAFLKSVFDKCKMLIGCVQECRDFLPEAMKNPCLSGSMGAYFRKQAVDYSWNERFAMFTALDSCNAEIAKETCESECQLKETSAGSVAIASLYFSLLTFYIGITIRF